MLDKLRKLLLRGPRPAKELYGSLGISQPTFSNLINSNREDILVIGRRRSSVYALIRQIRNLPLRIPIYSVREDGSVNLLADIIAIYPQGFYVESQNAQIRTTLYQDLPYWLADLIPSGFLGRLIPRRHPELLYPDDIKLWSSDDCLHYWYTLGWDLIGNLILGDLSLGKFQREKDDPRFILKEKRETDYDALAMETLQFGAAGSSAAGEQPKFLCTLRDNENLKPVLVKFATNSSDQAARRRQDLLICEYLALKALGKNSIEVSEAELINTRVRLCLELTRFDRMGLIGRRGVIALSAVNQQFSGKNGSWLMIAKELHAQKLISTEILEKIAVLHYFGLLIDNNDMHQGNLSFFTQGEEITGLAPVYDMLPMAHAPIAEELIMPQSLSLVLPPQDKKYWIISKKIAEEFWKSVAESAEISDDFKTKLQRRNRDATEWR